MWSKFLVAAHFLSVPAQPPAPPTAYQVLAAEYARGTDAASLGVLQSALASGDTVLQRLAVRAFGRLENKSHVTHVAPMLSSPSVSVRREALNAYGQMGVVPPFEPVRGAPDAVLAVYYETLGRVAEASPETYATLTAGLTSRSLLERSGAARGLESLARRTARAARPAPETVTALKTAFRSNPESEIRQLLLLTLSAAADRDSSLLTEALRDTSAMVRRLAVMGLRHFVTDASPMVRYHSMRFADRCEQLLPALRDVSEHVVLVAIDAMGDKRCAPLVLDSLARTGANWRVQSHALVSLARSDSIRARAALPRFVTSPVWQARTYAASAAKLLRDTATLSVLARDTAPNVAIAALTSVSDALRGLNATHFGLVLASATRLKNAPQLASYQDAILTALLRLSARNEATTRDPRVALLQRLQESANAATAERLRPLLNDPDPVVANLAARVMSDKTGSVVTAATTHYSPAPFPSESTWRSLQGATARLHMRSGGIIEMTLLPDDAPATVATFVALAERGAFRGLTWHRIVANFVLQGGSPGADEYDGLTTTFMRDEVGLARHARGSFGISTRGRDTGDGQIFINLVDNFRLDHDYTVFAQTVRGLDVIDRVQEGDVIEQITIQRRQ